MNSKKIRLIAASVLIGLMLLYVYRYHLPTSPDGMVHKDAQAVVLIDARALEAHMIKDVLLHPLSYIGGAEQPDREEISQPSSVNLLDCLELPRGLAFSQIGAEEKVWVSNDIGIRDETLLRTYLEEKGYKLLSDSDNSIFVKEKLYLSISGNHARLGWGEAVKVPALSDHTNAYLTVGDKLYDAIDKSGSDITYIDTKGGDLYVDFEDGEINLGGSYNYDALRPSAPLIYDNSIGQLSAHLDVSAVLSDIDTKHLKRFRNFTKLDIDSLSHYLDGKVCIALEGITTREDTIITYEYDDDFNQVEVKSMDKTTLPSYSSLWGCKRSIRPYMTRKKAITHVDGNDVFALMPLVTTYALCTENLMSLSTSEKKNAELKDSNYKLKLNLDLEKISAHKEVIPARLSTMLTIIKHLELSIANDDKVVGKIMLADDRNSFVSLVRQ